jgi:hypothetical protein
VTTEEKVLKPYRQKVFSGCPFEKKREAKIKSGQESRASRQIFRINQVTFMVLGRFVNLPLRRPLNRI